MSVPRRGVIGVSDMTDHVIEHVLDMGIGNGVVGMAPFSLHLEQGGGAQQTQVMTH